MFQRIKEMTKIFLICLINYVCDVYKNVGLENFYFLILKTITSVTCKKLSLVIFRSFVLQRNYVNVEQIFRSIILTINHKHLVFFSIMLMLRLQCAKKIYYWIDEWNPFDVNTWYPMNKKKVPNRKPGQ